MRFFGDDPECSTGVWQALRELKCVFLSHVHGDHHGGVAKLLAMRRKVCQTPDVREWALDANIFSLAESFAN